MQRSSHVTTAAALAPASDLDQASDQALLARYAQHADMDAFKHIVARHQARLLRLSHALLADHSLCQDAVQECFLRLAKRAHELLAAAAAATQVTGQPRPGSLAAWLSVVARNLCLDLLRRSRPALPLPVAEDAHAGPPTGPSPLEQREQAALVWRAVDALPPLERACVLLRYRDGHSYEQIAANLDKTVNHVGVLLHAALRRLRGHAPLRAEVAP